MKKIAVTGADGMLGSDFCIAARKKGWEVLEFRYPDFNMAKPEDIKRLVASAPVILNCAAYTAVDKAEVETELCRTINASGPAILAEEIKKHGSYLIQISTDFVFGDLSDDAQNEDSKVNPLSVYGLTKYEGEQHVFATGCKASVMRVEWTFGRHGNNFVSKMLELASKMKELKVVDDQIGSPTPTVYAAEAILCLAEKQPQGLFHFASNGYCSRYECAKAIFENAGIKDIIVHACKTGDFKTPARRPLNSKFNCSKIDGVLNFKRPLWQDALAEYMKQA